MRKRLLSSIVVLLAFQASVTAQTTWVKAKEELLFTAPPFQQCHASTLVEVSDGSLLVACFGGSGEGAKNVAIWLTTITNAGQVAPPKSVADGMMNDTLRYPTWNPVLFKAREGTLFLFYKVGPNPREWWGMVKTSADEGKTWSGARRLPDGILGPIKNKPVQLANGTILAPSSTEEATGRWQVHLEKSTDLGQTWQVLPVDPASSFDVIQPSILTYPGNRLQLLCRSKQGSVVQAWSMDGGNTWGKLSKTTLLNPNSGTDALTLKDGSQLLVYNPDVPGKEWFNGRSKLRVAQSTDGQQWHDIVVLEDGSKEEYSYPAIIQARDGRVHITYTYDRKNVKHVVLTAQKSEKSGRNMKKK
ncbi:exo-alpha-sialidase [Hymenobacter sp. BT186]|uniref:Exo-alpha-sialidase n=1 Tax=Hymenobacter telluris TaxID=2816474 RepID=A0A939EXU8_9BACT|nr:sialidase family protein [Hymenobacter telluris]MBO0358580.1 exo-alpha-sialidase [Hymenobacter telluris]MBW3374606.1 exo-alpha-sialidase [Hymenobacter norwichensis]